MFAAFNLETVFPTMENLPEYAELWLRKAGVGAMAALVVWFLWFVLKAALRDGKWVPYGLMGRLESEGTENNWRARVFWMLLGITSVAIIGGIAFYFYHLMNNSVLFDVFDVPSKENRYRAHNLTDLAINVICLLALLTVSIELIFDLARLSFRRVFAIAKFSIKEANPQEGPLGILHPGFDGALCQLVHHYRTKERSVATVHQSGVLCRLGYGPRHINRTGLFQHSY
jgi:hypothetical protein